jgi:DNA-directed RNA polymerase subunit M/transcription elongation factor TFIIS
MPVCSVHKMQYTTTELAYLRLPALAANPHQATVQDEIEAILAIFATAKNTALRCPACHSTEVRYEHRQSRSMDEGMTTYFTCRTCTHPWKD